MRVQFADAPSVQRGTLAPAALAFPHRTDR
jgi:hypothetical protein